MLIIWGVTASTWVSRLGDENLICSTKERSVILQFINSKIAILHCVPIALH